MLLAFVAVAVAITYNAAYLQKGPHPAPMSSDEQPTAGQRDKSPREVPSHSITLDPRQETTASLRHSKTIQSIQQELVEKGYEPGPVDGVQGQMTMAAVMAYQHDHDLPVTGIASAELLKNIILGGSIGKSSTAESVLPPEEMKVLVQLVQKTLSELDYAAGPVDGLMGTATQSAIKKFERDRNLSAKGRISGRLLRELMQANGGGLSKLASN